MKGRALAHGARKAAVALLLLASGCVTYSPKPLTSTDATLAAPVEAIVESRANEIERAWLAPVTVDLSNPLTPEALAAITVANDPDLIALRARAGVADAQAFAAGLLPDPTFSVGVSPVFSGPDTLADLSGALGFDLNALRTRAVRRDQAVAQQMQVRLDLAWAEWQAAGQARLLAARVIGLEQIADLARTSQGVARSLLERTSRAAVRGDVAGDRVQSARLSALTAQEAMRTANQDLASARSELLHLLGLPPERALQLARPVLPAVPNHSAEALFQLAQANRTDLAALREGYAAQEATVHQAVLDQFPNLGLTLNAQRDSGGNFLAGPSVDFTLPLWNRNRGGIAIERATREALRAEYDARLSQTRTDIALALKGIALASQRRAEAATALPQVEQFAAASQWAARRGDISVETAETAAQTLRDQQTLRAQAEQALQEQIIALELLTGTPREAWPQ